MHKELWLLYKELWVAYKELWVTLNGLWVSPYRCIPLSFEERDGVAAAR